MPKVGMIIKIEIMKERIYKWLVGEGFIPVGSMILKAQSEVLAKRLKFIADSYPNDATLGCEIRKLINE